MLKIKRLLEAAVLPEYAHEGDAGFDLRWCPGTDVTEIVYFPDLTEHPNVGGIFEMFPLVRVSIRTGIAVQIPDGHFILVKERSSIGRAGLVIAGGVIDQGYRGEIALMFIGPYDAWVWLKAKPGDRLAQGILLPVARARIEEVEFLDESTRGSGGFGSTGRA